MKKLVLTGFAAAFVFFTQAQVFKKGDAVEINKNASSNASWLNGKVIELNQENRVYVIKGADAKLYNIPFAKENDLIRRPSEALTVSMALPTGSNNTSGIDLLKQKVKEEFETDFSEYDSVTVTYNSIEPQKSYKNTDEALGKIDSEIFPYKVDITVRLVSIYKDGTLRKINWQFKRKYLLFQTNSGNCAITVAEKEENLLSNI